MVRCRLMVQVQHRLRRTDLDLRQVVRPLDRDHGSQVDRPSWDQAVGLATANNNIAFVQCNRIKRLTPGGGPRIGPRGGPPGELYIDDAPFGGMPRGRFMNGGGTRTAFGGPPRIRKCGSCAPSTLFATPCSLAVGASF